MAGERTIKVPKTSRQNIERYAGRELGKLMFEKQQRDEAKVKQTKQQTLMQQALKNIKEHCFHVCEHCQKYVDFPQDTHREETINGSVFWIGVCPECHKENYQNIFLVRTKDQMGDTDWYVDARWYKPEDVKM